MTVTAAQRADLDAWNRLKRFEHDHVGTISAFRSWFSLSLGEARLLEALYLQPERFVTTHTLSNQARIGISSVRVLIGRLRKAMESEAIDGDATEYCLTEIGLADCRNAIADARRAA